MDQSRSSLKRRRRQRPWWMRLPCVRFLISSKIPRFPNHFLMLMRFVVSAAHGCMEPKPAPILLFVGFHLLRQLAGFNTLRLGTGHVAFIQAGLQMLRFAAKFFSPMKAGLNSLPSESFSQLISAMRTTIDNPPAQARPDQTTHNQKPGHSDDARLVRSLARLPHHQTQPCDYTLPATKRAKQVVLREKAKAENGANPPPGARRSSTAAF
jgi:hypothetical protein